MTIPRNRPDFERLTKGVVNKNVLDDDDFNPKNIYQRLTWDFSNDSIIVDLPTNAVDVAGFETLDPNDATRTRIHRDCEFIIFLNAIFFTYRFGHAFRGAVWIGVVGLRCGVDRCGAVRCGAVRCYWLYLIIKS